MARIINPKKMLKISPLVGLFCVGLSPPPRSRHKMPMTSRADLLHDDIRDASKAMSRSVNAQAEYWIRLGMMSELYPELNHQQIKLLMLKSGSDRLLEVINAINNH